MTFARTLSKARMAPIAGFLALTAVSAALAQTIDGIDLKAIKDRATEATADAQTLVDAVAGKGEAHRGEAETLREQGLAAVAAIDPASLPKGPDGAVDFDELLSGAAANTRAPMGEGPMFMVFASLSMPQASLSRLIADTSKAGGVVVFRGFPGGSTKAFAEGLKRVVTDEGQEAHIAIDPRLFRAFKVEAAPTFVAAGREYELCDGLDCTSATPDHDRLTGNVTVEYALESFAGGKGPGAGIARVALAQLAKAPLRCGGRRFAGLALAALGLIAATGAAAQVYIPPPDDLVEPQPPLPPAIDPGVPAPAPATTFRAGHHDRGRGQGRGALHRIERARRLPGDHRYAGRCRADPRLSGELSRAHPVLRQPRQHVRRRRGGGYNSDAYRTANSTTRPTVDVTRADLSRANTVTDDPNAYLQG
jgi:conjugal transfer pilus assembly protein TrbC